MPVNAAPPPRRRASNGLAPTPIPTVVEPVTPVVESAVVPAPLPLPTHEPGHEPSSTPELVEEPVVDVPHTVRRAGYAPEVDELGVTEEPVTSSAPSARPRRLSALASTPRTAVLASEPLTARRRKRRLVIGGVCIIVGLLSVNTLAGVVRGAPSANDVATVVAQSIPADGYYSSEISVGEQFLRAYLNSATTPEARTERDQFLNSLSNGAGSKWVSSNDTETGQTVLEGPHLIQPPRPSEFVPGADTLVFGTWVSDGKGTRQQLVFSVLVSRDENGFATVAAAPSLLPTVTPKAPDLPTTPNDGSTADAVAPNLEQFLKVWAQAGPDADQDITTQLNAFLAPDATFYTSTGLSGTVTYDGLTDLMLTRQGENSPIAVGTGTVVWKRPNADRYRQSYSFEVEQVNGKWLVRRIGAL